ncbi:helix-turn-helix domain-containing protein [Schaalia sp. 19OD2882]|nr:helix-turn-helix domain-containing protein [Schaalia sp. 19OD2882]
MSEETKANRIWLTTAQAADRLAVSKRTLMRLRQSGAGPRFHKRGQIVRYRADDVDRWMGGDTSREAR